jgi:hypothetical protein
MTETKLPTVAQQSSRQSLRTTALVIYTTLALLALTIPQSLVNWLQDKNSNVLQEKTLEGAKFLQDVSDRTGIAFPFQWCRQVFLAVAGKNEE